VPGLSEQCAGEQVQQMPEMQRGCRRDDYDLQAPFSREAPHRQNPESGNDADLSERAGEIRDADLFDLAWVRPEERYPRGSRRQPEDHLPRGCPPRRRGGPPDRAGATEAERTGPGARDKERSLAPPLLGVLRRRPQVDQCCERREPRHRVQDASGSVAGRPALTPVGPVLGASPGARKGHRTRAWAGPEVVVPASPGLSIVRSE
jgi:hypothetical protein